MIEIVDFTRKYGETVAVDRMNLLVPAGRVFGLLGPNGAGKSTTVKCITGLLRPTSGTIRVLGKDVTESPEETKAAIGYVPENPALFRTLTCREVLTLSGRLYRMDEATLRERREELLRRFGLAGKGDEQVSALSKGMTQKLAIASALLHAPRVLILDEPLNGLDAASAAVFKEVVRSFAARGGTVVFCSHTLEVVERLCDGICILAGGRVLRQGTVEEIVSATGAGSLEEAFIRLTGLADVDREAAEILSALDGGS